MAKSDATKPKDSHVSLGYKLQADNDASVEAVLALIHSDGWTQVTSKPGVTVFRKFMQTPPPSAPSSATNFGTDGRAPEIQGGLEGVFCGTSRSLGTSVRYVQMRIQSAHINPIT